MHFVPCNWGKKSVLASGVAEHLVQTNMVAAMAPILPAAKVNVPRQGPGRRPLKSDEGQAFREMESKIRGVCETAPAIITNDPDVITLPRPTRKAKDPDFSPATGAGVRPSISWPPLLTCPLAGFPALGLRPG